MSSADAPAGAVTGCVVVMVSILHHCDYDEVVDVELVDVDLVVVSG